MACMCVFQTVIGLVYNPVLEQLYWARPGSGSFCNGQQLHVTNTTRSLTHLNCPIGSSGQIERERSGTAFPLRFSRGTLFF